MKRALNQVSFHQILVLDPTNLSKLQSFTVA
jgi:hypothetical protein